MITPKAYVEEIRKALSVYSNKERSKDQKAYMRDQFEFLGLTATQRRTAQKPFLKKGELPNFDDIPDLIRELWKQPEREFQYFGQELLAKYKRKLSPEDLLLLEFMITYKSWWDTVDFIASHLVGSLFASFPAMRVSSCDKWFESQNIWLQRTTLLFQLKYKEQLDTELLSIQIDRLAQSEEFFIRKAIGWTLREYSKTNPDWVLEFVDQRPGLSNLSRREALRLMQAV